MVFNVVLSLEKGDDSVCMVYNNHDCMFLVFGLFILCFVLK